jgi:tripartite-type tricarboxylate transporter receptor subunit TctC
MRPTPILMSVLAASLACATAHSEEVIKIIVPFAAGGPVDTMARLMANEIAPILGKTVIVDDRGGAGGVIGTDLVSRASADGNTLLMASLGSHVISAVVQPNVKYDPVKSFDPIAMVGSSPTLLVTYPDMPAKDFKSLIALAQSKQLTYGSAGPGTTMNLAGELINAGAHVSIQQVPYRGVAPALPDLMGGRLDMLPADPPVLLPLIAQKKVRALAVLGRERLSALPDVPTSTELGYPTVIMENWYGLLAPAGLSADVGAHLEKAALQAINSPKIQEHMKNGQLSGTFGSADFKARIEHDTAFWREMIPKLGITVSGEAK